MNKTDNEAGTVDSRPPVAVEKRKGPLFDDLGPGVPPFEDYFSGHIAKIQEVQGLLAISLDDHLGAMDAQLRELEAHLPAMRSVVAWADSYLDMAEHQVLSKMPPRASDWTDLDRDKALAAGVTRQRRFRDVVLGIVTSIEGRISYAQSRLKAFALAEGQKFQ